jgi:hypothetical protein
MRLYAPPIHNQHRPFRLLTALLQAHHPLVRHLLVGYLLVRHLLVRRLLVRHLLAHHLLAHHLLVRHLLVHHLLVRHLLVRHPLVRHLLVHHLVVMRLCLHQAYNQHYLLYTYMQLRIPYIVGALALLYIIPIVISMMLTPRTEEGFINLRESKRQLQSGKIAFRKRIRNVRRGIRELLSNVVKKVVAI